MFDIGWTELMVIGIVALIVIGPKDLPEMFRTLGRFTAKAKGMAREFSRAMETAADEAGVKDVAADLRKATSAKSMGLDAVKDAAGKFESWDPMKSSKASAAKPDPAAPTPEVPTKGPETQAMTETQTAKRTERPAVAAPAKKPAAKPKAKTTTKAGPKAAAKKTAAKKPSPKKSDV
ncbi:twin-arginine translocase subunit TatB [Pseudorhodobacter turbinis]|uniref:Sec-independent protein translocase protein TatB n=1 Tax=Pseudorhodobacter turbinis TaxID=2500533 RepID=A0A4P8EDT1_9RHOB|nr:Sec-independent protein translocase protein TatB [Pseudorhodobacter turbinis]QCO54922.1 twin-arginine translocase subunit TatB [Pseudorhodobacter turbinis]